MKETTNKEVSLKKNIFLLTDDDSYSTDAVILTDHTTKEELETIIQERKEALEYDYQWEDILGKDVLPDDCEVITIWSEKLKRVFY